MQERHIYGISPCLKLLGAGHHETNIAIVPSSPMIDHFLEQASTENYGVAYIYFNFKEQNQQRPVDVLASLVKQLACQIRHLPQEIGVLHEKLASEQKRATLKDLYSLLLVTAKFFTKTFIICDALDECDPESQ